MPGLARYTSFTSWRTMQSMVEADFRPASERDTHRLEQLRELAAHAWSETLAYRELLDREGIHPDDIRSLEDFARIPVTTKSDLRQDFPERHLARGYRHAWLRYSNTSGTTGRPLVLIQDLDDICAKYAATLWSRRVGGVDPLGAQVRVTPNECQPCQEGSSAAARFFVLLERRILNPIFHRRQMLPPFWQQSAERGRVDPDSYLDRFETLAPDILVLYPLYALALARHLRRTGRRPPELPGIIDFSGGVCTSRMRQFIHDAFGRRTTQCCGGCEFARYGASCEQDPDRLHLAESHCYVEVVDPDGAICKPGQLGNLIVTSLHSRAMPTLRLEPGDVGRVITEPCSCGRSSRRLQHEGRIQALLRNSKDRWVTGREVWDRLLFVDGIDLFQLQQQSPADYLLLLQRSADIALDRTALDDALGELLGAKARVELREVDAIAPEASGKLQLVKSCTFEDFRVASARRDSVPTN